MNILKQLGVLDTDSKMNNIRDTKWRLTLTYSLVIIFVIAVLNVSVYSVYNQGFSENIFSRIEEESHEHLSNEELSEIAGEELIEAMILIDITLFALVFILSYFLSRQALRPIDKAYNDQKRFLGDVAHELRTPLTVMRTGLEAFSISQKGEVPPQIRQSVEEVDHMSKILNDLMFLIKNETLAEHHSEKINISEIVSSEIEKIVSYANTKNIKTTSNIEPTCYILGNETEIRQLIKNLLKNGVDYNKPNGDLNITLTKNSNINLEIRDTGVGIKKEDQERIFHRFFRSDNSRSTDSSSTGLGLAVVKSIADKHKAAISIHSDLGLGTRVIVQFKAA